MVDITGQQFNRLTAVRFLRLRRFPSGQTRSVWLFRCTCGKEVEKTAFDVKRLDTKSCGCGRFGHIHNRLAEGESSFRTLYHAYKARAKIIGVEFGISEDVFRELTSSRCHYCDAPPYQVRRGHRQSFGTYLYNGLDRLDVSDGYIEKNVVPCCGECNKAKGVRTKEEFIGWALRVARNIEAKERK